MFTCVVAEALVERQRCFVVLLLQFSVLEETLLCRQNSVVVVEDLPYIGEVSCFLGETVGKERERKMAAELSEKKF